MLTPLLTNGDGVVDNVGAGERVVIAVGAHIDPVAATPEADKDSVRERC